MNDFKIKLILPPYLYFPIDNEESFFLPYGAGILAQFLKDNNYDVILDDLMAKIRENNRKFLFSPGRRIDLAILQEKNIVNYLSGHHYDKRVERIVERITQIVSCERYNLIGISVPTYAYFYPALLISRKIKSINNNIKIVLGGSFVSIYGKRYFNQSYYGDYMIVGDGQVPLLGLVEYLAGRRSIKDVPNLLYREDGAIKENPREIFSIEDLSIPDFLDLPLNLYKRKIFNEIKLSLPYQITRGCSHRCSFCQTSMLDNAFEFKSYAKVIEEIGIIKKRYQSNYFHFGDDSMNCSYEYLDKLCDIFIEKKLDIIWTSRIRADNLDRKILHKMKKSGCVRLFYGIESGSDRILESIGKGFNIEQASMILRYAHQEGINNQIFLLSGYPHEKQEDIVETVRFIKRNVEYIDGISGGIQFLRVLYGAPLFNNPRKYGIENLRPIDNGKFAFDEIDGLKWAKKVQQQTYSRKKIYEAYFKYILCRKYRIKLILSWFYFWLDQRLFRFRIGWFFELFERFGFRRILFHLYRAKRDI